jgi:hypothetical protein
VAAVSDWWTPLAFFALCGVVGYPVARLYVAALLFAGRRGRMVKFLAGVLLWLGLAILVVLPLFVFLVQARADVMYLTWGLLCYGALMLLPAAHAITRSTRELREVGFWLW